MLVTSQMKAVAGMKMSYSLQQAISSSRRAIVRGFRQDETHTALCSHLFTMIRGNRQHRRAFLISLLNLFDDSAVSKTLENTDTHFLAPTKVEKYNKASFCLIMSLIISEYLWLLDIYSQPDSLFFFSLCRRQM